MTLNEIQHEVGEFYSRLWDEVGGIEGQDIIAQFLYNVALPREWFKGKKSLDVGCGSGFASWVMEQLGAICYACDISHNSLLKAKNRIPESCVSHTLTNCSAIHLPYPSDTFDFVHCNGVLHHTTDPRKGFNDLVRVTKPKGKLFVSVYGKGGIYNMLVQTGRFMASFFPYRFAEKILNFFLKNRKVPSSFMPASVSILDNLYVPIRESYKEHEIIKWFLEEGFSERDVIRTKTTIYDHEKTISRLIHGEGYLQFQALKPE